MSHEEYMMRCLKLAQNALGYVRPNPMVGAMLVHNDRVISEGWHHYYGAAHAEVNCLENVAPEDAHLIPECTMYVNLEPCAHYGITPPCATRLISEKIKRVVIANTDPFNEVDGRGIAILREMGIEVITGVLEKEGYWLNRRFFCSHVSKRPYIILKWAQSTDGFIGTVERGRAKITGQESQRLSHRWRNHEAAIMVGFATALNDNPQLTARLHKGRQPLRIVIDRDLQLPLTHNVFKDDAATWILNRRHETISGNVHFIRLNFDDLLPSLLERLREARILSLVVEGGAQLLASFINAGLWDEARVFTGPGLLGAGVAAPVLTNEIDAFSSEHGKDNLHVYTNKNSGFEYIPGIDL